MTAKNSPLILVDGSSYLFRAYYALPPLTTTKAQPTGAIYGVLSMLRKLISQYSPQHIAVVFDPKGGTFRHELYPQYKANRAVMPDDLAVQIKPLHEAITALGIPLLVVDGVEADDVIGTIAHHAEQQGFNVVISTSDKDLAQLVNSRIILINTMTDKTLDPAGVENKFGVSPQQIIDYLTLTGDSVDNIPGVPKVGPKTASKWLAHYGSLDNIVTHADEIKGKVGEYLREFIPQIPLTKELVTIKIDVELPIDPAQLNLGDPDNVALKKIFTELEFKKWLLELDLPAQTQADKATVKKYEIVVTKKDFTSWLQRLAQAKTIALDTETTSLDAMQAKLVGLSFTDRKDQAAYVPLRHLSELAPEQLQVEWVIEQLRPLLADKNKCIVGQNLKYDIKILRHEGLEITAPIIDTLLQSYVLKSTSTRHDMTTLAQTYLDYQVTTFEDIAGKGAKQLTFDQIHLDKAGPYAAEDADVTLQLYQKLAALISDQPWAEKILKAIEMPLMPILADMEYHGVLLDADMLAQQSKVLQREITQLEKRAFDIAGQEFNLNSPKQLQDVLYEKLKLPIIKKTPKGQASTAENVLRELAINYPLPDIILQFRSLSKLKSTYTDNLPKQINPNTGRVHTHYNQVVTSTGRLSSNDPNLQNIPVRTDEGRKIRQAFVAPKGYRIVAADYSQIELRIMAHFSEDPGLLKAFAQQQDVHSSTAAELFGVKNIADVTAEQRRRAKAINFGLMYGMSSFGVAQQLGISRQEAQQHIDVYFERYQGVKQYMQTAREHAAKHGYVETLLGRRLFIPDINAKNFQLRSAAERQAINAPLQGTAAEIIKLAMIGVHDWLMQEKMPAHMIMQVHDELIFEVKHDVVDEFTQGLRQRMEAATKLRVPLIVDVGIGNNWDEAH